MSTLTAVIVRGGSHNGPPCRRALSANQESLTSQTYFMFTLLNTWPQFSNARADGQGGNPATSLEGIHNTIHDLIGGGGHAGDVSVAGLLPNSS